MKNQEELIAIMNFNAEMIEKAKVAKTAEELYEIAKANGVDLTADEAATYFAQINPKSGELDDDDLDAVAGGGCEKNEKEIIASSSDNLQPCWTCSKCGNNTSIKRDWVPSTGGCSMAGIPTYCGVCGERAWCSTCQFCERRSDGYWCINPNRQ